MRRKDNPRRLKLLFFKSNRNSETLKLRKRDQREHSATSQGVDRSGRRTPGGKSRARRFFCDQHCSPHFCTQNDIAAFSQTPTLHAPNAPPLHNPTKPKTAAFKQKGTHTTRSLALSPQTHRTQNPRSLSSPPPRPLADFCASLSRRDTGGVLWTPGTSFFSDGSPGSRSISLVHAPSDWPDRK